MKITDIRAVRLNRPARPPVPAGRRPSWWTTDEVANPMSRYPKVKAHRELWLPKWESVWCKVTLEDGTWGFGQTSHGRAVAAVIDDHLGPRLIGEDCLATDKLADILSGITDGDRVVIDGTDRLIEGGQVRVRKAGELDNPPGYDDSGGGNGKGKGARGKNGKQGGGATQ